MSSAVEICNLALSHLGDTATVASIDPPEGSAQAEHCARFYPIARDALLEKHDWSWATRRSSLALLVATVDPWAYAYAKPNLMKKAIAVLDPEAGDDYSIPAAGRYDYTLPPMTRSYAPRPFVLETLSTGEEVILTDQEDAVLRYTVLVTDTSKFPAMFVAALSWLLASMLAGPIIKGETGMAEAKHCLAMFEQFLGQAIVADSNQRRQQPTHIVPWISGR